MCLLARRLKMGKWLGLCCKILDVILIVWELVLALYNHVHDNMYKIFSIYSMFAVFGLILITPPIGCL